MTTTSGNQHRPAKLTDCADRALALRVLERPVPARTPVAQRPDVAIDHDPQCPRHSCLCGVLGTRR